MRFRFCLIGERNWGVGTRGGGEEGWIGEGRSAIPWR